MESINVKTPQPCDLPQELFTRAEFREELSEETGFSNYSYWRSTFRTFFKSNVVKVIVVLLLLLVSYTIIYPMVTDRDPYTVSLSAREWNLPPSAEHPFGTDGVGLSLRDQLAEFQHINTVGNIHHQVHMVFDKQNAQIKFLPDLPDKGGQLHRFLWVHACCRLIQ